MSEAVAPELESAARKALAEVTPLATVGDLLEAVHPADAVVDLAFDSLLPGYVGWRWTVSLARLPDEPPSVLEVELLPGGNALVAPSWVPWAERLAEYRRTHPDEQVDAVDGFEEDDLDADEDALEEADDELDGVEFETPADEDGVLDDDDLDDLPDEFADEDDEDEDDDEDDLDDLPDDEFADDDDEALHGPADVRLRGD